MVYKEAKFVHIRIRSTRGCKLLRPVDPGRPGRTKLTVCVTKPSVKSEVQRILVEKGTKTFGSDLRKALSKGRVACKRRGGILKKHGTDDYRCVIVKK